MQELLEIIETPHELFWRRRNEERITGPRSADPVLRMAKLAWLPACPPAGTQQDVMHLAEQAKGKGKSVTHPAQAVLHGGHIVRDFGDILEGHRWQLVVLEQEQIGQGGLRAFDLRREEGFLADVHE